MSGRPNVGAEPLCLTGVAPPPQRRHHSSDSATSGRDRSYSTDSGEAAPSRLKEEAWLLEISASFLQQYVQYLQSIGFILVQVRPPSPARRFVPERVERLRPGGVGAADASSSGPCLP